MIEDKLSMYICHVATTRNIIYYYYYNRD